VLVFAAALAMLSSDALADRLVSYGRETVEMVHGRYFIPGKHGLYADALVNGKRGKQVAFNWGCGVWLSALNGAASVDAKYKPWLKEFADATHRYWNPAGPVPGFDVLPMPKQPDRYYDDNEWMALALADTAEVLHEPKYKAWAEQALQFALSGQGLDEGIFWREKEKSSKNTCSNAPAAAALLQIASDRSRAEAIYAWTKQHLQDPVDLLMWDNVDLKGKVDKTKWSYNTGLMIRTASVLGLQSEATAMAKSSVAKWLRDGMLVDEGKFVHLLVESWTYLDDTSSIPWPEVAQALIDLHDHKRSPGGQYPSRWDTRIVAKDKKNELIDQASYARACFVVARRLGVK